ncbi:hypothetical protein MD484_g6094, partial [Candolleomyces efflorescens]
MVENAKVFAKRQCFSTPLAPSLAVPSLNLNMDQRKEQLDDELAFSTIGPPHASSFASSLYRDLASDEEIEVFLRETEVYDWENKRWLLPESIKGLKENELQKPLVKLLNAVLAHFWSQEFALGLRKVIDTHTTPLPHKEVVETDYKSRPDCSVKAEGPSFQLPHMETTENIGYSNMASFFEFKVEAKRLGFVKELLQVAAYVRQMFIQQPNRQFVRALLVSEQRFTLFHFDRSGVQHSQQFELSDDSTRSQYLFVRLVVGLCSPHESDLGFDSSIQWKIENGRKVSGTLKTCGGDDHGEMTYNLVDIDPIWSSFNIRGSCTRYWRVVDPQSGEKRLVKDSWRSEERVSEQTFLDHAKDLPGVVEMIYCEDNRAKTKDFRGFVNGSDVPESFCNLIAIRIIMRKGCRLLMEFSSPMELVCACRDAIAGHQLLYELNIVHRDISIHTILLGEPEAEPGNRGVLAGLDMAIFTDSDRDIPETNENGRFGDRTYWPIAALARGDPDTVTYQGPHDHLDDLESFLYVFVYLTHGYSPQGKPLTLPRSLQKWALQTSWAAAQSKTLFLGEPSLKQFQALWPQSCRTLVSSFKNFSKGVTKYKRRIARNAPDDQRDEIMEQLMVGINEHYNGVLRFFDKAIEDLDKEANQMPPQVRAPVSWKPASFFGPPSSPNPCLDGPSETSPNQGSSSRLIALRQDQGPRKRASEEDPDDQPEAKRAGHEDPDEDPKTPSRPRARARMPAIQTQPAISSPLRPKDSSGKKAL